MAKTSCSFGYAIHTLLVFGLVAVCLVLPRQVSCNLPAPCNTPPAPPPSAAAGNAIVTLFTLPSALVSHVAQLQLQQLVERRASGVGRRARYVLAAKLAAITCNIGYTYLHIDAIPSRSHTRLSVSLSV